MKGLSLVQELVELLNGLFLAFSKSCFHIHSNKYKMFFPDYSWHIVLAAAVRYIGRDPGACLFIDI